MRLFRKAAQNLRVASQLLSFFCRNKRWWLVPMLVMLIMLSGLIVLAQSSAVVSFFYTLF